jgi:hypothetical protein
VSPIAANAFKKVKLGLAFRLAYSGKRQDSRHQDGAAALPVAGGYRLQLFAKLNRLLSRRFSSCIGP